MEVILNQPDLLTMIRHQVEMIQQAPDAEQPSLRPESGTYHYAFTVAANAGVSQAFYEKLRSNVDGDAFGTETLAIFGVDDPCPVARHVAALLHPSRRGYFVVEIGYGPDTKSDLLAAAEARTGDGWGAYQQRGLPHVVKQSEFRVYVNTDKVDKEVRRYGGSAPAREVAAILRRCCQHEDLCVWYCKSKKAVLHDNVIPSSRMRPRKPRRSDSALTAEQERFVRELGAREDEVDSRREFVFSTVPLTRNLSVSVQDGLVCQQDEPTQKLTERQTILTVAPPRSGWKRAVLFRAVTQPFVASGRSRFLETAATLVVCQDQNDLRLWAAECKAMEKHATMSVVVLQNQLPCMRDLEHAKVFLLCADEFPRVILDEVRKQEILRMWCGSPEYPPRDDDDDDDDDYQYDDGLHKVEKMERDAVVTTALRSFLKKFAAERCPLDLVLWRRIVWSGDAERTSIEGLKAKVFLRRSRNASQPLAPPTVRGLLRPLRDSIATSSVIDRAWMTHRSTLVLQRPRVTIMASFVSRTFNALQEEVYLHYGDRIEMQKADLGIYSRDTLRFVGKYRATPKQVAENMPEVNEERVQRMTDDPQACDLCKEEDCDAVLSCGHMLCAECAADVVKTREKCWKCTNVPETFCLFGKSPGYTNKLPSYKGASPCLDHVAHIIREKVLVESKRICVAVHLGHEHVVKKLRNVLGGTVDARDVFVSNTHNEGRVSMFCRRGATASRHRPMVAVVNLQDEEGVVDCLGACEAAVLVGSGAPKHCLRKLRDHLGGINQSTAVDLICVASSTHRRYSPSIKSFLSSRV